MDYQQPRNCEAPLYLKDGSVGAVCKVSCKHPDVFYTCKAKDGSVFDWNNSQHYDGVTGKRVDDDL